jgi:outer membrane protein assembly factor BamB
MQPFAEVAETMLQRLRKQGEDLLFVADEKGVEHLWRYSDGLWSLVWEPETLLNLQIEITLRDMALRKLSIGKFVSEARKYIERSPDIRSETPIVWNDRIFVVTCIEAEQARLLMCFNTDGKEVWRREVLKSPLEQKHTLNSFASSTPATDGQLVYVAFLDQQQMLVAAYDFDGNQKWLVRPGPFKSMHGFCSSPVLHEDKVIVNGDHDGDSYIVALDRNSGRTLWKTPRENHTRSYCVPLIRELAGRKQMILSGDKSVASYDPNDGSLHWIIDGPTEQFVASLVYSAKADLLFMTGGFPDHHLLAIKPDGRGNVTNSKIVWRTNKGVAYVPSPIVEGNYLLIVSDSGVAHCFEAATGKLLWQERLGEHHASLVSANGLVYFLNDDGVTHVVKPGPVFELIARNEIGEKCFASPAISRGQILLRGTTSLFCAGAKSAASGKAGASK